MVVLPGDIPHLMFNLGALPLYVSLHVSFPPSLLEHLLFPACHFSQREPVTFEQKSIFVVSSIVNESVVYLLKICNALLDLKGMDSSLSFMNIGKWGEEDLPQGDRHNADLLPITLIIYTKKKNLRKPSFNSAAAQQITLLQGSNKG